jgi:hypothetical protein
VPVVAKVKTRTGRIWTYVRDDSPFGGKAPPAAVFFYSRDRARIHPEQHLAGYSGILQADAYAGFNGLYAADRRPGPITEAGCWAHARRKLFELADIASKARERKPITISPIAFEAIQKFDAIFMLERSINGLSPEHRVAARRKDVAPLVNDLMEWMKRERAKLSRHNEVAKAMAITCLLTAERDNRKPRAAAAKLLCCTTLVKTLMLASLSILGPPHGVIVLRSWRDVRNSCAALQLSRAIELTNGRIATESPSCTTITESHPTGASEPLLRLGERGCPPIKAPAACAARSSMGDPQCVRSLQRFRDASA